MKNGENPANPISRIENCEFFPRRLSAKPAQVRPTHSIKSLRQPTKSSIGTRPKTQATFSQNRRNRENENCCSSLAPLAFTSLLATMRRSDFCVGVVPSSLPPSGLPLEADPRRPPWVMTLDVPPLPPPLPLRPRMDFGRRVRRHADPAGPACSGVHLRSVLRFASGFFPTRPPAPALASHDGRDCVQLPPARGCYHLAPRRTFTSNPVPMPDTLGAAYWSSRREGLLLRASHRTGRAGHASGSLDRYFRSPA